MKRLNASPAMVRLCNPKRLTWWVTLTSTVAALTLASCRSLDRGPDLSGFGNCDSQVIQAVWDAHVARLMKTLDRKEGGRWIGAYDLELEVGVLQDLTEIFPTSGPGTYGYSSAAVRKLLPQWKEWFAENRTCLQVRAERGSLFRAESCEPPSHPWTARFDPPENAVSCDTAILRAVWNIDAGLLNRSIEEQQAGYDPKAFDLHLWPPGSYIPPHELRYALGGLAQVTGFPPKVEEIRGDEDASLLDRLREDYGRWFASHVHCLRFNRGTGRLEKRIFCS